MKIIALVGKSGTGKSYRAVTLAYEMDIEYIIDDGLLIKGNKVIAGSSAKREKTKIAAVKRALFLDKEHREKTLNAIEDYNPDGILIIGTSEKMVNLIAENLKIAPIDQIVYIEDIATKEEIATAQKYRKHEGKHVIPVPTFEIKKHFSGYFIDPLKIFRRRKDNTMQLTEKSVVRPTFSYLGKYTISDKAITQIIKFAGEHIDGLYKITRVNLINYPNGVVIKLDIVVRYGYILTEIIESLQKRIKREIENMTALNILSIDVFVKSLLVDRR
jgi:uncharacterized alkaline shock family protein YloU/adenylate kinase family enzyme